METVFRVAILYAVIFLGLRVLGKREFGDLAPFDLVLLLLIPELAQQARIRDDYSLVNAAVAIFTLLSLVLLTSTFSYRLPRLEKVLHDTAAVLVEHGDLVPSTMNRQRVTPEEILDAMHNAGLERIDQVTWAILGTDGRISIIPWWQSQPVQHRDVRTTV